MASLATYKGAPRYRTNSDGTVSLIIGGKVASTFANKEEARAKVKDARTKMREANINARAISKIPIKKENGATTSYTTEGIKAEAAKAGISFGKMKRQLMINAQKEALKIKRAARDTANTYTAPVSTTQTSSMVNKSVTAPSKTQAVVKSPGATKIENAINSTAKAINKKNTGRYAGRVSKYSKLR